MIINNPNKTPEQYIREHLQREQELARQRRNGGAGVGSGTGTGAGNPPPPNPARVINVGDYLKLENIVCTDADGKVFERYGEIYVAKDIVRNPDNSQVNNALYQWAIHFEPNGLFLPSFALTCNILAVLFRNRSNAEFKAVLDHYKSKGQNLSGYHAQNSIIDFSQQQVVHYPTAADFSKNRLVNAAHSRKTGSFDKSALQDGELEHVLRKQAPLRYARQLTGLHDPSILVEIGKYFGKTAKLWFPWSGLNGATHTDKRAAWFGCNSDDYFVLNANYDLNDTNAARGVRLSAPQGAP